jgi:hypothetical protein
VAVDKKLIKSAGEHWVCSVLSRLGWAAALTRDGVERTDILAVHPEGLQISIQVKTSSYMKRPRFRIGAKGCAPARSSFEWFVLVALGRTELETPRAFVVPRDHLAAGAWIQHMEWLTNPTAKPGTRNAPIEACVVDGWMFERYEQQWGLLHEKADGLAVLLPPRCRSLARNRRVMLPPGHRWATKLPKWDTAESSSSWSEFWRTEP